LLEIEQRLIQPVFTYLVNHQVVPRKLISQNDCCVRSPESKATALPDLVAQGLCLSSEIEDREKIDSLVKQVIMSCW
jgi:hypothetical protein